MTTPIPRKTFVHSEFGNNSSLQAFTELDEDIERADEQRLGEPVKGAHEEIHEEIALQPATAQSILQSRHE